MEFPDSAAPRTRPCKICNSPAPFFGAVDFNRTCRVAHAARLPLYGFAIYYRRCQTCGFLFTDYFDDWGHDSFRRHIYNDDYAAIDPDYDVVRPAANAKIIEQMFRARKHDLDVLDFGGGNGLFAEQLRALGFRRCDSYDPFTPGIDVAPARKYGLVTSFETLEHTPDPVGCVRAIADALADNGCVVFSTLVQPQDFEKRGLDWWYVGPRNGHISLQSSRSLATLWENQGFVLKSFNQSLHKAQRQSTTLTDVRGSATR